MRKLLFIFILVIASAMAAFAQPGKISGKLTYPGEGIPRDLVLCVKFLDVVNAPVYCSNNSRTRLSSASISFKLNISGASYVVNLPSGNYLIYATTAAMSGVKAYYDEFIKCGMSVNCTSKRPITVKVKPGASVGNIMVGDFW